MPDPVVPPVATPETPPVTPPAIGSAPPATPPASAPPATPPADQPKADAWRDTITDPELKEAAKRYTDIQSLVKSNVDFRKRESTSVRIPGKDAKPEEIAEYREKMGVPKDATGYAEAFARPQHIEETVFSAEPMKAVLGKYGTLFHDAGLTKEQAAKIMQGHWTLDAESRAAAVAADKAFVTKTEDALRQKWPGAEYDKNKIAANRAATQFLGEALEQAKTIETKDGRFLLDHPIIVEAFAKIGREMGEDRLGPIATEAEIQNTQQQIDQKTKDMHAAMQSGDRKTAARLDQERNALIQKTAANRPIVGSQGRAA